MAVDSQWPCSANMLVDHPHFSFSSSVALLCSKWRKHVDILIIECVLYVMFSSAILLQKLLWETASCFLTQAAVAAATFSSANSFPKQKHQKVLSPEQGLFCHLELNLVPGPSCSMFLCSSNCSRAREKVPAVTGSTSETEKRDQAKSQLACSKSNRRSFRLLWKNSENDVSRKSKES